MFLFCWKAVSTDALLCVLTGLMIMNNRTLLKLHPIFSANVLICLMSSNTANTLSLKNLFDKIEAIHNDRIISLIYISDYEAICLINLTSLVFSILFIFTNRH